MNQKESSEMVLENTSHFFYQPKGSDMCKLLMEQGLDNVKSKYQFDFSSETQNIYHEFFDSLNYIIEQAIVQALPHTEKLEDFIEWYSRFMAKEVEFFLQLFPNDAMPRFNHFLSLNEFNWLGQRIIDKFSQPRDEQAGMLSGYFFSSNPVTLD